MNRKMLLITVSAFAMLIVNGQIVSSSGLAITHSRSSRITRNYLASAIRVRKQLGLMQVNSRTITLVKPALVFAIV